MTRWIWQLVAAADDRSNPILVKEVRVATRSRTFAIFFILLLVGAMVISTLASLNPLSDYDTGQSGRGLFLLFAGCLVVAAFATVPWMAFRAVVSEREQNTLDLLAVSGMNAGRIVRGKLNSALLTLVTFFSAVAPFMAMSFLLRGIDIVTILLLTGWIFILAVLLTMGAIWWATLARTPQLLALLHILLIIGLVLTVGYGWTMLGAAQFTLGFGPGPSYDEPAFWWIQLAMLIQVGAFFLLFYAMAVSLLTFESANRSTGPRLALLGVVAAQYATFGAVCLADPSATHPEGFVVIGTALSPLVFLAGLIAVTENRPLSRRVQRQVPCGVLGQLFAAIFYPGPGRGWLYLLLLSVLAGLLPAVLAAVVLPDPLHYLFGSPVHPPSTWILPLWLAGYSVIYLGLANAILRAALRHRPPDRTRLRWFVLLVILAAIVVPFFLYGATVGWYVRPPDLLIALGPTFMLANQPWDDPTTAPVVSGVLLVLSVIALAVNIPLVRADLAEQARLGAENRRRRRQASVPVQPAAAGD